MTVGAISFSASPVPQFADGLSGAPTGPANLPHLLDLSATTNTNGIALATRPPWNVAGVDYRVGINTGVTLQSPATIPTSGNISRNGITITLAGNGTVLDGFDFSLDGGFLLAVSGTNCIVQNCNFDASGANANTQNEGGSMISSAADNSNLTVQFCELNGGGATGLAAEMLSNVNNIRYCFIHDSPNDFVQFAIPAVWRFNLFMDAGTAPGSHADFFQIGGAGAWNYDVQFCTTYQSGISGEGTQGHSFEPNSPGTVTGVLSFNTGVYLTGGGLSDFIGVRSSGASDVVAPGITVTNNYVYPVGMSNFYATSGVNTVTGALVTFTNNVNMQTGALIISNGAHP